MARPRGRPKKEVVVKKPIGAQIGSKNALKLKTPELKEQAYDQYCEWVATGNCKRGWHFIHPTITLWAGTMEKYIKNDPESFPAWKLQVAEARSYAVWEDLGKKMMLGEIKGCQPALFQMFMRNKFGWDRETHVVHSNETDVRRLLEYWEKK